MLDQVLAGNSVTLGLAGWAAYGLALAVGLLALVLLALPSLRSRPTTARRPDQVVIRANDDVGIGAYLPGLILGVIAAALAWYGGRPHVVIAADSLTCRPWTRPLQMSEIRAISAAETGRASRPAVELDIVFAGEMRRGGVMTRAEEVAIALVRGPSRLVARERSRGEGTCPLGGLAIDGREAAALIQVAWGRAAIGALPDAAAIETFCASAPPRLQPNCADRIRRGVEQCRGSDGAAGLACRYQAALGERPPPAAPPPRRAAPPAPPTATPAPPRTPTTPPTATPPTTTPPTATPPAPTPPSPPAPTPPTATPPATPTPPRAAPPPPGKPPAPPGTAPPPGKPS